MIDREYDDLINSQLAIYIVQLFTVTTIPHKLFICPCLWWNYKTFVPLLAGVAADHLFTPFFGH